mgnify:CR=1 FL=1
MDGFNTILFDHLTFSSSSDDMKCVAAIVDIPKLVDDVMGYLTPEPPTDLSDAADIEGVSVEDIRE